LYDSVAFAESFAALLPLYTEHMDAQFHDQERALDELGGSIDEVSHALPAYASHFSQLMYTARLLTWLVACIVGFHGAYLVLSEKLGKRFSV
jgi:hypothetical protein